MDIEGFRKEFNYRIVFSRCCENCRHAEKAFANGELCSIICEMMAVYGLKDRRTTSNHVCEMHDRI